MEIKVSRVDYKNSQQTNDLLYLLNTYALDPMGGGKALDKYVIDNLVSELSVLPHAFSVIGYIENEPVGLINCFEAFSTFLCKPLVNIHDVIVLKEHRGKGISQKMLSFVEKISADKGCCKLTLEVLSGNKIAKSSYQKYGFTGYELDPTLGKAEFWQKLIQ
jgi:ribosomal protein S18 acetylase RimI-like enzyme